MFSFCLFLPSHAYAPVRCFVSRLSLVSSSSLCFFLLPKLISCLCAMLLYLLDVFDGISCFPRIVLDRCALPSLPLCLLGVPSPSLRRFCHTFDSLSACFGAGEACSDGNLQASTQDPCQWPGQPRAGKAMAARQPPPLLRLRGHGKGHHPPLHVLAYHPCGSLRASAPTAWGREAQGCAFLWLNLWPATNTSRPQRRLASGPARRAEGEAAAGRHAARHKGGA
jgi:hypothetical protein